MIGSNNYRAGDTKVRWEMWQIAIRYKKGARKVRKRAGISEVKRK